jgi:ubiquinone/menaquinone biosynthesis C-methylase UbiE
MGVPRSDAKKSSSVAILTAFLRFFFRHLYTTMAWTYDAVAWIVSLGLWSSWQDVGLEALPKGRVLELGHGPGYVMVAAGRSGRIAYGIDPSAQMSRIAARRLRRSGSALRLARAKAEALPFAASVFDGVISTFPSEYIMDPTSIDETRRVMKPGGKLVIILIGISTGRSWIERFAAWVFRATGQGERPGPVPRTLFADSGMEVVANWVALERSSVFRIELLKPRG